MNTRIVKTLKKARKSFRAANAEYQLDHKSLFWDQFDEGFDLLFDNPEVWENIRNNSLAERMGGGLLAPPESLQIIDSEIIERLINDFNALVDEEGLEFVLNALEMETGRPEFVDFNGVKIGKQDILFVHNLRVFLPWFDAVKKSSSLHRPIVAEIGGGYGGFAAKIMKVRPVAKVIIFDLPESGAFQNLYLSMLFPDKKILSYCDIEGDLSVFIQETDFDALLLPGWKMDTLEDGILDMAVSLRAFMEFNLTIVENYIRNLERILRVEGLFYLSSRIEKHSTGEKNILKKYPFDGHWSAVQSNTAFDQTQLHELVLARSLYPNAYTLQSNLISLPPYDWENVKGAILTVNYRLNVMLWGNHPGVLGGLVPNAVRRFLDSVPLLRMLARSLKKFVLGIFSKR
jgi:putative sugar O-methyltransferase